MFWKKIQSYYYETFSCPMSMRNYTTMRALMVVNVTASVLRVFYSHFLSFASSENFFHHYLSPSFRTSYAVQFFHSELTVIIIFLCALFEYCRDQRRYECSCTKQFPAQKSGSILTQWLTPYTYIFFASSSSYKDNLKRTKQLTSRPPRKHKFPLSESRVANGDDRVNFRPWKSSRSSSSSGTRACSKLERFNVQRAVEYSEERRGEPVEYGTRV